MNELGREADERIELERGDVQGQRAGEKRRTPASDNALSQMSQHSVQPDEAVGRSAIAVEDVLTSGGGQPDASVQEGPLQTNPGTKESDRGRHEAQSGQRAANVEQGGRGLEEVVVTAQRREERTIDVPMSITAISGEKLDALAIRSALDLSRVVPGLNVSETGPGRQSIMIRGVFSQRGTSSLTGVYLDEMSLSGVQDGVIPIYADVRTIDLEHVEVLKGPQGTLFGEGAAGGVVRFITRDPDLARFGGELSAEVYDTVDGGFSTEARGVVNIPLENDRLGIRLAGSFEDRSGWIDQPTIGRKDINNADVRHGRAKIAYSPNQKLKLTGMFEMHRDRGGASNIVNQSPHEYSNFRQAFDLFAPTGYTNDYELYNVTVRYDLGFAELLSSTSRADFNSMQNFTQLLEAQPVPWLEIYGPLERDAFIASQEVRLTSTSRGGLSWTLGGTYKEAEMIASNAHGSDVNLRGGAVSFARSAAGERVTNSSESWAAFADAHYQFLEGIEVGSGLRYFEDERDAVSRASSGAPDVHSDGANFSKVTYRIYAKYKPSESTNVYASIATGFRSGGMNAPNLVARGAPIAVGEENTKFYEAGIKTELFDGSVRVDAAAFYGEFTDMQETLFTVSSIDGAPLSYAINGQDARLQGGEVDARWALNDQVVFAFGGDVTDSQIIRIKAGVNSPYKVGDPINMIPDYSLTASVDYRLKWSPHLPVYLSLSFNRQGRSYNSRRNSAFVLLAQNEVPEKDFLNASVQTSWNGLELTLFGRNLLDETDLLFPTENGWSSQARRRSVGIAISKTFD